jgi:hypothetical protein
MVARRLTCTECLWWEKTGEDLGRLRGRCRRRAPAVDLTPELLVTDQAAWPVTMAIDWCGDHVPETQGGGQ